MRKRRLDKALPEPEKDLEFEARGNKEYKVKVIINSAMYGQQANNNNQIPGFYYLVSWKGYPKEKNTWEPLLIVIYFQKLISTFHKEHAEKLIATFLPLDSTLLIAKPSVP